MMTAPVPDLVAVVERGLRAVEDTWDNTKLHVSDLGYALPAEDGGKCARQLWLRLRGAPKRPHTAGELLMFDRGTALHVDLVKMLERGMIEREGWAIRYVEHRIRENAAADATGLLPDEIEDGTLDLELLGPSGEILIVDFKTLRGGAFRRLDAEAVDGVVQPYGGHRVQVRTYAMGRDAAGAMIFYADREGQNFCRQAPVARDDEEVQRLATRARTIADADTAPPVLTPVLTRTENKGPDSLKIDEPWQCARCVYRDFGCPGAVSEAVRPHTGKVIGHISDAGELSFKTDEAEVRRTVEELLWHSTVPA